MTTMPLKIVAVTLYAAPSSDHWLGTDALGRAVGPMLLEATFFTAAEVFVAATLALAVGLIVAILGSLSRGGLARFCFAVASCFSLSTPLIALLLLAYSFLGDHFAIFPICAGFLLWGNAALTLQTAFSREWRAPYMRAARAMGTDSFNLVCFHLLPNVAHSALAAWFANWPTMLSVSVLTAFLGASGGGPRLGVLLKSGFELYPACWWLWLPPTLVTSALLYLVSYSTQSFAVERNRT